MNYMTRDFTMPPYMVYPKFLLRIDINETARMIYTILLDRARLSLATEDYIDDYGHVYVFYTIDNLAQTLHKSDMTVKTALAALEDKRLIKRVHQGIGLPNKIYVRLPPIKNAQNRGQKTVCTEDRNLSAGQKENFLRDGKKTFCLEERKLSGIKNEYIKNDILKMREQEEHTAYGSYKNVFLSGDEYRNLAADFKECDEYIERLSVYMASTGKSYSNHAATVRKWIMQDKPKIQERNYDCREDESL